jgi:hypothetical protein
MLSPSSPYPALTRWERLGLVVFFLTLLIFGCLVEFRSAFLKRRMTDLDVYLRAAWAVRTGGDFYAITDDNGWHYHYPPLLAIALVPLADPPAGADRTGMLPFAVSVAIWYVFSVLCLAVAVHWLASALEQTAANPLLRHPPGGCRRWWALRILPLLACLPTVGATLMRGQVNLLLLLLLCGMVTAWRRGRRLQSGLWLAGAISLKIIPAMLLIYPVWRRDLSCLAGCAVGLVLGLGVIPALVFGPAQALAYYQEWDDALRKPMLADGADQSRAKELIEITATESQSYLAVLHNTLYLDRSTRPAKPSEAVRWAHWLIGGVLTGLTLLAGGRRPTAASSEVILLGALFLMMVLLSPVCHLHYFCLSLPLVMAMRFVFWERSRPLSWKVGWWLLMGINLVCNSLPHFGGLEVLRDVGLAMYAALLLWLVGSVTLWQRRCPAEAPEVRADQAAGLAA